MRWRPDLFGHYLPCAPGSRSRPIQSPPWLPPRARPRRAEPAENRFAAAFAALEGARRRSPRWFQSASSSGSCPREPAAGAAGTRPDRPFVCGSLSRQSARSPVPPRRRAKDRVSCSFSVWLILRVYRERKFESLQSFFPCTSARERKPDWACATESTQLHPARSIPLMVLMLMGTRGR